MARPRTSPQPEVPGLAARRIAADILDGVLRRRMPLDEQLSGKTVHPGLAALADRDRALMRRLAATVLRRLGTLRYLLGKFLEKGFPSEAPRRFSGSRCPTMPRSIFRCGWRKPTAAPPAMPGWSTRCCAAWRKAATPRYPIKPRVTRRIGC